MEENKTKNEKADNEEPMEKPIIFPKRELAKVKIKINKKHQEVIAPPGE